MWLVAHRNDLAMKANIVNVPEFKICLTNLKCAAIHVFPFVFKTIFLRFGDGKYQSFRFT